MINVIIEIKNKKIISFCVRGHTQKENYYKIEPLCATISAVVLGGINTLTKITEVDKIKLQIKDGFIKIEVKKQDEKINTILETMIIQIETIKLFFKKNISIKKNKS